MKFWKLYKNNLDDEKDANMSNQLGEEQTNGDSPNASSNQPQESSDDASITPENNQNSKSSPNQLNEEQTAGDSQNESNNLSQESSDEKSSNEKDNQDQGGNPSENSATNEMMGEEEAQEQPAQDSNSTGMEEPSEEDKGDGNQSSQSGGTQSDQINSGEESDNSGLSGSDSDQQGDLNGQASSMCQLTQESQSQGNQINSEVRESNESQPVQDSNNFSSSSLTQQSEEDHGVPDNNQPTNQEHLQPQSETSKIQQEKGVNGENPSDSQAGEKIPQTNPELPSPNFEAKESQADVNGMNNPDKLSDSNNQTDEEAEENDLGEPKSEPNVEVSDLKPSTEIKQEGTDQSDSNGDVEENIDERKEKLETLKNKLQQLLSQMKVREENSEKTIGEIKKELEKTHLTGEKEQPTESIEENYDSSNTNQELINRLNELAPFQDRERGPGYAIDTNGHSDIPDSVIRTLITKFLNQRFLKKATDLNIRSNSLEKTSGFHKWDVKAVVTHLKTHQLTKVLTDKYGYEYDNGKNEDVPLSFYFDLSGSMSDYTNLLATISIELLKKNVKVLVGYNERVNYQIDSIKKTITVKELATLLTKTGEYNVGEVQSTNAKTKKIDKNIDNYLLASKAEKCVVFSDFDPIDEVINLSSGCNVYWFCFEQNYEKKDLQKYNGFIYPVQNIVDIAKGLLKVSDYKFETLCYLDKTNGRGRVKSL